MWSLVFSHQNVSDIYFEKEKLTPKICYKKMPLTRNYIEENSKIKKRIFVVWINKTHDS